MSIIRRQTGYDYEQGHELIVYPQKVAYEISESSSKENKSFNENVNHSQNQMRDLLSYKYIFEPSFFQLSNPLNYKAANTWLEAEEFLPSLKIDAKMAKKINTLIQDGMNSTFFLTGSSFEPSSHDLGNQTFFLDKASFDFDDSFEKALYGRKEYSVSCFCIGDSSKNIKPSRLVMEQVKETVKGLSSFKGMEVSYSSEYQYRRTDLLYLNHFRIFLFFQDQGEGVKIQRFIYYPRVNFSTQLISQPFRFVSTPLTSFLAQKTKNINISLAEITKRKNTVRYGFLGLDSAQRMLPLCASDDYCVSNPLIGVWTYGINYTENSDCDQESRRFVWSLLAEFSKNTTIAQRFSFDQERKSFILAVFNLDESAKYFEVCIHQSENEDITIDSNSSGIVCSWCMLKNFQVDEQKQGSKKYNQLQDSTFKLTQELLFRFSPKMVVERFDDEEFCQPSEEPRNIQYKVHAKQQSQKRISSIEVGSNNNETVKMIGNRQQKYNDSQQQEDQSLHQKAAKIFENMQTSKQALKSQIEIIKKQEESSRENNHIQANNQTFSQNSNIDQQQQSESKEVSNNGLPGVAEKIIKQQQEQIDQMKEQIQQLTNALMTVKQQQSQNSLMSQSYVHQTQSPISQSQVFPNQSQQLMYPPQRYPHPQQQMYPPNQHLQHYPPYMYQGQHPQGYMFDPYSQPQYYPFPPPGSIQEPYGMYPRGQGYPMHESIISGDGKSNRSVDSIHLVNKRSIYQEGNHNRHINPSNASDFAMSEVQSVRNNYEDQQSVKNKDEEAENESFKQLNYAPFHAQINFMKAKQLEQSSSIPGEQISFAQNSFAGGFNQQNQDSFEKSNQQQLKKYQDSEGSLGKQNNVSQQKQLQQQNIVQKQQQQSQQYSKYEHLQQNLKESNQSNLNNLEKKHSSSQEDDQVQQKQYQTQQYNSKTTQSSEPKELDSKLSPMSFIGNNTPISQPNTKASVQTKDTSHQFKENQIDQRMQLELARKAVQLANLDSEETFTMDEKSHPKMNLDFLDQPNITKGNYSGKTSQIRGKDQKAEIPTIKYHDYAFDSDSDEEVKVIQKKYNMRN